MMHDLALADEWIPSSLICGALREEYDGRYPTKRKVVELATDGTVPLIKPGKEWGCVRSQLPAVARALGLRPKAPAPQPRRAKAADAQVVAA